MKKLPNLICLLICLFTGFSKIFAQETLTNESIISLTSAKVSNSIIVSKIKSSANNFDLSTSKLIDLKNQKVSDNILGEMMLACHNLPPMKNDDVIQLHNGKLGKDLILKKINLSQCNFNTSTESLIALKNAGVPEAITKVMMDPTTSTVTSNAVAVALKDHPTNLPPPTKLSVPGIYYEQFAPKTDYVMIEPTTTNQTKKGGFGESLGNHYSGGISGISTRVGLSGVHSSTTIEDKRPVFYFYLSLDGKDVNQVKESTEEGVASPKEFVLVKATQTKRGREIQIARKSAFADEEGFAKGVVDFKIVKVSDRLYKVYFTNDVPAGEYAFYYNKSSDQKSSLKLYDFSLRNNITINK
jgi:DNA-directed RNA polymerase subunit H (RpoH/RPB5)